MRRLWLLLAIMVPITAQADGYDVCNTAGCFAWWRDGPMGDPNVRYVPQAVTDAEMRRSNEHYAKWFEFCKPAGRVDRYGVTRYSYAHDRCEYGRTE
jgi:hypothetical protein